MMERGEKIQVVDRVTGHVYGEWCYLWHALLDARKHEGATIASSVK